MPRNIHTAHSNSPGEYLTVAPSQVNWAANEEMPEVRISSLFHEKLLFKPRSGYKNVMCSQRFA